MNPSHKLSKLANRERRLQRRTIYKDLGNKLTLEPAEAAYHAIPALPKGNLTIIANIQISPDNTQVTRALRAIMSPTLVVAQTS